MDYSATLMRVAEMLQAPVATSVAGKGVIPECHPLAVGWGYGPQGTRTAEQAFRHVDLVLALGVRYSEVSTAFYSIPRIAHDSGGHQPRQLGRIVRPEVCVNADAGMFLEHLMATRPPKGGRATPVGGQHCPAQGEDLGSTADHAQCGVDPMVFLLALRRPDRRR